MSEVTYRRVATTALWTAIIAVLLYDFWPSLQPVMITLAVLAGLTSAGIYLFRYVIQADDDRAADAGAEGINQPFVSGHDSVQQVIESDAVEAFYFDFDEAEILPAALVGDVEIPVSWEAEWRALSGEEFQSFLDFYAPHSARKVYVVVGSGHYPSHSWADLKGKKKKTPVPDPRNKLAIPA